jgi:hypothetical protein
MVLITPWLHRWRFNTGVFAAAALLHARAVDPSATGPRARPGAGDPEMVTDDLGTALEETTMGCARAAAAYEWSGC